MSTSTVMTHLIQLRRRLGYSQETVAGKLSDLLGTPTTQACVSYWEAGKRQIDLADAEALATVLGTRLAVDDRLPGPVDRLEPVDGDAGLYLALTSYPDDDERHWLLQAHLFTLLAAQAQTRAARVRAQRTAGLTELEGSLR